MTPKRRAAAKKRAPRVSAGTAHFAGALAEDFASKLNVVLEAVQAIHQTVAETRETVAETRETVAEMRETVAAMRADMDHGFSEVRQEIRELTAVVARKAEGAALVALERRVSILERAAG